MMIAEKMLKELNKQINEEMYSSYVYLSMAAYLESENFPGFAQWMKMQSEEEYAHSMKFYHYINEVMGRVELLEIKKPPMKWKSVLDSFQTALKHELHITERINLLANLSLELKDHATHNFLHWFIDEQVEEVNSVSQVVDKLKFLGDSPSALYLLDKELGKRKEG